ncbi:protein-arginine deiminase type-3-like [Tiliqua scincoides]|uniref:protein-arginine deiminase type-3-like n=1 Tax=Tiliqua scincoides TaxID=71010 RepID=UPI0034627A1F
MTAKQRVIRVSTEQPNYVVCVLGTEISIDVNGYIPKGATSFDVRGTSGVRVYVTYNPKLITKPDGTTRWPLNSDVEVMVVMNSPSSALNDNKVRISYYGATGEMVIAKAWLYITCIAISLDADTRRTGMVATNATKKTKWTWGPQGEGAVLLVNCDRDGPSSGNMDNAYPTVQSHADLQDMSLMILTIQGPVGIFDNHKLLLHVSMFDAAKVRVFQANGNESPSSYEHVLGSDKLSYAVKCTDGKAKHSFFVEGLAFPDADFAGLISLHATLLEHSAQSSPATPVFTDTVVFRVAPWLMTPNTQKPLEIFVCSIEKGRNNNQKFLEAVKVLAKKANCELRICPEVDNRGDRWIQDEMEFGYVEAPTKSFPVVFDSPRNRGLKEFPFKKILGPDFGYVTREPKNGRVSSLDSFGNLDVSPPVTVRGKEYPLGRILIGSSFPGSGNRKMTRIVRDFLYAQKVQPPVELYSDWLTVGHVDEFLSFVPAPDRKGFRLLLASPHACLKLFKEKQKDGYGGAALFEGRVGRITLDEILSDEYLHSDSKHVQSCIDWNRNILKRELGLSEQDIIDIPQLFTLEDSTATALFPDMVNMLVLGKHLGIPKPFGPVIHGQCCLEKEVRCLLEPLGLTCTFIDDFFSYHVLSGEVHCATNVCREPFSFHWWNMTP